MGEHQEHAESEQNVDHLGLRNFAILNCFPHLVSQLLYYQSNHTSLEITKLN